MQIPERLEDPKVFLPEFFKALEDPGVVKDGAAGQDLTIQFTITDDKELSHSIRVNDGAIKTAQEEAASPTANIKMGTQELKTMFTDPGQAQMLFMSGQIQVEGDMGVLMQMNSFMSFGKAMGKLGITR